MGTAKSSMVRRTGPLVRSLFMVQPPFCNHNLLVSFFRFPQGFPGALSSVFPSFSCSMVYQIPDFVCPASFLQTPRLFRKIRIWNLLFLMKDSERIYGKCELRIGVFRRETYLHYSGNGSGRQGGRQTLIFPKEMLKM